MQKVIDSLSSVRRHPLAMPLLALCALALVAFVHGPQALFASPFLMGALTEGQYAGEFILSEANGDRSRENVTVTVPAGLTFAAGSVLGKITATGKYVLYDEAAADGSQTAVAVLYAEIENETAGAVDYERAIVARDAEVRTDDLQWKDGVDEAGGIVDLAGVGIIARS